MFKCMFNRISHGSIIALLALLSWFGVTVCAPSSAFADTRVVRVDGASGSVTTDNPAPDGSDWGDLAFLYLQDAIEYAQTLSPLPGPNDKVQIWVIGSSTGGGRKYYPDDGANTSPNGRDESFTLHPNVSLYGGFDGNETGSDEEQVDQREPSVNITILDGDIGAASDPDDNSFHVVSALDDTISTSNCRLDGFTIRNGNADSTGTNENYGGGALLVEASPLIYNCKFTQNSATELGGAVACLSNSTAPIIQNCLLQANVSPGSEARAGRGGAVGYDDTLVVLNSTFFDNTSTGQGGAISTRFNTTSHDLTLVNCRFVSNEATYSGGSVFVLGTSEGDATTIINCLFNKETAGDDGGGISITGPILIVMNSVFVQCRATGDGGEGQGGGLSVYTPQAGSVVTNCIFRSNQAEDSTVDILAAGGAPSTLIVSYSNTEQTTSQATFGDGMIHADPNFVDPDGVDVTLGTLDDDYRVSCGSPCINTGDPDSDTEFPADDFNVDEDSDTDELTPDMSLGDRLVSTQIDMGCYETHGNGESECAEAYADITQDNCIDIDDLLAVVNGWDHPGVADISPACSGNGTVDIDDLLLVVNSWGDCCGQSPGYSPLTVGDCWDTCSERYSEDIDLWVSCYDDCLDALCVQELIECE